MNKRIVLACSALALSLALAACGGTASSSAAASSAPAPSSKAASVPASSAAPSAAAPSAAASSSEMMAGGYTEQRELTEEDIALFESVMSTMDNGKTYEPVTVATQVVAGTNYRFAVKVTENGNTTDAFVVIFQPLPGQGEPEFVSEGA